MEQLGIRTDVKCRCGVRPDALGLHYLTCSAGKHLSARHELCVRAYHEMARATGRYSEITGLEDRLNGFSGPGGHRLVLDQTITDWTGDNADVGIDYAVCHPCAPIYVAAAATNSLSAATRRAEQKTGKYEAACRAHDMEFLPAIIEVFGAMNPTAVELIKRAARILQNELPADSVRTWTADNFAAFHSQRISMALQRSNAKAIRLRAHRDLRDSGLSCIVT